MKLLKKSVVGGALLVATMGGGALGATLLGGTANAATSSSTTASTAAPAPSSSSSTAAPTGQAPSGQAPPAGQAPSGPHQANGITETPLTGDTLAKATAAATKAVPGATVERAETDAEGATYEVHLTKSDGSQVTVKLDADFKVTETLDGHA